MATSLVTQSLSVHFSGSFSTLKYLVGHLAGPVEESVTEEKLRAFDCIDLTLDKKVVTLEVSYMNVLLSA